MKRFLLNINTGKIHDYKKNCNRADKIAEFNKKWFDNYEEAVDYYEGKGKKGCPCTICLKEFQ